MLSFSFFLGAPFRGVWGIDSPQYSAFMGCLKGFIAVIGKCANMSGHWGPQTFAQFACCDGAPLQLLGDGSSLLQLQC